MLRLIRLQTQKIELIRAQKVLKLFDSSIYRGYYQKVLKKSQTTIINLEDPNLKFRHITHSA